MGHKFILTTIDYFTRWVEAEAVKNVDQEIVVKFVEKLITRFGVPQTIISDNGPSFLGEKVTKMALHYGIYLKTSSNYYPQGNGLDESINKNLLRILKRIMEDNNRT